MENNKPQNKISPIGVSVIYGFGKVLGDIISDPFQSNTFEKKLVNSLATHSLSYLTVTSIQDVVLKNKINPVSTLINNIIGYIPAAIVSYQLKDEINNSNILDERNRQLLADFCLFCSFVYTKAKTLELLKIEDYKLIKDIKENNNFEIDNFSNKKLRYFTDIMSSVVGSVAVAYATSMFDNNDSFLEKTGKSATIGVIFASAKSATDTFLTKILSKEKRDIELQEILI